MKKILVFCLILTFLLFAPLAWAQTTESSTIIKGIDMFGSEQITLAQIEKKFGDKLRAGEFEEVETALREIGKFAYVSISSINYFSPNSPIKESYVTIDLVDEQDKEIRMPFLPFPSKDLPDPDHLLALWKEYVGKVVELMDSDDELKKIDSKFLFTINFGIPALKKYEQIFDEKVSSNKQMLINILREDRNPNNRSSAAYLLARLGHAQEVIEVLLPAIKDFNPQVRNVVLRIFIGFMAKGKDVEIPLSTIVNVVNFLSPTDRNKGLALLELFAEQEKYKPTIIRQAGPVLIQILRLLQPNNHKLAYNVLQKASGKNFAARDYPAWEKWLQGVRE